MKIYGIVNQKGGVGKTTTAVNFAIGMAQAGKRVLAIDLDPQGSLTMALGYADPDQFSVTVSTLFEKIVQEQPLEPGEGILHHEEGIHLLPANIELAGLEIALVSEVSREQILAQYLEGLEEQYDVVVLDCSPSLGLITFNALSCADEVIIPVQAQYLSLKGMEQLFATIGKVKRKLNKNLSICGVLITMVNLRTTYNKEILTMLKTTYGDQVRIFEGVVPYSVRASEASSEGKSIFRHDPQGKVAESYRSLIQEVLN